MGPGAMKTRHPTGSDAEKEDSRDGKRAYEEFAAELDSEDEDISFLPPYASDHLPPDTEREALGILWEPLDSNLFNLLNDVLESSSRMPRPRRFALGTVAIIRNLLQPPEVARILLEQRRYPRLRFGDIAVQLGLLSPAELKELLEAQQEGVFTHEQILDTQARLEAFHLESERRESA